MCNHPQKATMYYWESLSMIQHKNPVEESFIRWISMHPESFHHLDMQRFYVFVHSVISYHAKSWYSFKTFKEKILNYNPNFPYEIIEYYFNLMQQLVNFSKESCLPLYECDDYSGITIKTVEKGKIVVKAKDR